MKVPEHIINHIGEDREQYLNSVVPPIFQSSIFSFKDVDGLRQGLKSELETPFYTRGHNPTVTILRKKLAALEGADDALVFGSGSAAIAAAVMSQVQAGDHVICIEKPYSWTYQLLANMLSRYGVEHTFVDGENAEDITEALKPNTRLVYLETPNSVTFEMQDIELVRRAIRNDVRIVVDNSYSTPLFQNPLKLGADIVVHSASKYLGGHGDVVAGVVCSNTETIQQMFASEFMTLGGIISPNDAWLILRGLRTLPIRMQASQDIGQKVRDFLRNHPQVAKIYHPFEPDNPQLELAKKQMSGAGSLFSFEIKARSIEEVETFCNNLPSFLITCSWGGYESLIFPSCALYESEENGSTTMPWNLIRMYVGLEDANELIKELSKAFELIK